MSWSRLLEAGRVARHRTSKQELDALRAAIERNLRDAGLPGLSPDNCFGLAYEAGLLAAKVGVHAAGYRVKALPGAHRTTFEAVGLVLGPAHQDRVDYFELCRRRRNELSYEAANIVTARQAAEILRETRQLVLAVEEWIRTHHAHLAK